jgi:hypothetical protein
MPVRLPSDESLGYFRSSLRDWDGTLVAFPAVKGP